MAARQKKKKQIKGSYEMFQCEHCGKTLFIFYDNYRGCEHYQVAELMVMHHRQNEENRKIDAIYAT